MYRISTYFFDKNKRNQPPLNHNKSVELEPSNTKNRFIKTQFST